MSKKRNKRGLASRLLAARQLRGLSQQDAADLIGVARNTVSRWELGLLGFHPAQKERVERWVAYWLDQQSQLLGESER